MSVATRLARPLERGDLLLWGAVVCTAEALLLAAYLATAAVRITAPRYLLYPFVWLNVAGLVVLGTSVAPAPARRRAAAVAVAGGYFLALAAIDGTLALSPGTGLAVHWGLPPGWGPLLVADLGPVRFAPIPYRTVGYAAIAYLLYVALVETSSRALGGLVGLFSCVSCTLPVLAAALSGVAGGSAAAAATTWSYDLSTAVFLLTVGVLTWQTSRVQ